MLVTLVLLAILTLGAVSASDVDSESLAVDDVGGGDSVASPVDDADLLSDGNGTVSNPDPDDGDEGTDFDDDGDEGGDEIEKIWVDESDLSLDDENLGNHFAYVNTPEDAEGYVLVNCGGTVFFNKTLSSMDQGADKQNEGYYWHGISLNDVGKFDGLKKEDMIIFSLFDEDGQKVLSRIYFIYFGEGTIRLENDDSENLDDYTTIDGLTFSVMENMNIEDPYSVIKVAVFPDGIADSFSISLQKDDDEAIVTNWTRDSVDRDRAGYAMWNIQQLEISEVGVYSINFIFDIGNNTTVINVGDVNIGSEEGGDDVNGTDEDTPENELNDLIMDADEGSTLFLDKDYIFSGPLVDYISIGISIDKEIIIDGQGHTIDANNYCTIFAIDRPGITLKNIIFRNGHVSDDWSGGAIGGGSPDLCVVNCTFENNVATHTDNAGAIAMIGDNIAIINSTFINNEGYNMGSIRIQGSGAIISNCVFMNNRANTDDDSKTKGGAISIYGESATITDCEFVNNTADLGSDIFIDGSSENFIIESCMSDAGKSSIYFAESNEGGDDEFDPTKFSIDRRDDENNILALQVPVFSLYCPDGSEGTVDVTVSYNGNDYSVSKNISEMDENNYLHWYLNDLNMNLLVKYKIHVNVNDGEFESDFDAYVHGPISSFTYDDKLYINTFFDYLFEYFEVPSEYDDARVIVEFDGMILFNKTLKEFEHAEVANESYYWYHPSYGPGPGDERFKHYVVYNGAFGDIEAKTYNVTASIIFENSPIIGNHTFISTGTIDVVEGIVENKGVKMEAAHDRNYNLDDDDDEVSILLITAPEGANGKVTVSLNDKIIFESNLDELDSEDGYYLLRPGKLELDNGEYELTFAYFEDDEKIVETSEVFTFFHGDDEGDDEGSDADDGVVIWVNEGDFKEFDLNNEDDLNGAFAYVSVSKDLDGAIVIYCFDDEEGEEQDWFHIMLSDVISKYDDEEYDGFTVYEISLNSLGDRLDDFKHLGWFKIVFIADYGEESSEFVDSREYSMDYDDEANIIKFWPAGGDEDDGVAIWVREGDDNAFDLSDEDDLNGAFAYVSVSKDLDGTIVLYCFNEEDDDKQDFFHIDLSDVSSNYDDEERDGFTIYELSLNSLGDKLDDFKKLGWFELAFVTGYGEEEQNEVDSRAYNIDYNEEDNVIKFWQDDGEDDPILDEIEFNFIEDDEDLIFEMGNNVHVANLLIPDLEEFEGTVVKFIVRKNGKVVQEIISSDIEHEDLPAAHRYPICIDLTKFEDKDVIGIWADCFDEDGRLWEYAVQVDGDNVILHEYSGPMKEYYIFYGNITKGDLNDPELMGEHPNGRFVSWGISDVFNITEGTITIRDGETTIGEYSLNDCNVTYSYNILGNVYYLSLEDYDLFDILPENRNVTFTFSYVDESLTFKRIRLGDYVQKVITPDDFAWEEWSNYKFEVVEGSDSGKILTQNDDVVVIYGNSNMQSIFIDFGGGYFSIYVNDTKVENLGYVLHNAWVNSDYYNEDDDYLDDWIPELFLSRLRGGSVSLEEFHMKLADLGITQPGTYNIKIIHTPVFDSYDEGEYIYQSETLLVDKNVTYDPDCIDVYIRNESRYQNNMPFLITFELGENLRSQSNVVLGYVNGELAFNKTVLFYEEDEDGEMELVDLWKITPSEFNEELLNEYGFLDAGEYEVVVYFVKGDNAPVEIGSGNFTVLTQKGNMNFTLGSDNGHAILYADIPEGKWDGYSLEIYIDDSEPILPSEEEVDDWCPRWYDEYVIFKDDQIALKESLDDIIGKGPVAIDLGILDEGTHIWVVFYHGEETIFGGWDFYQNDFTVTKLVTPEILITAGEAIEGSDLEVSVDMADATGVVSINGVNVTLTDGKASTTIKNVTAGDLTVNVAYFGDDKYTNASNSTTVAVKAKQDAGLDVSVADISVGQSATVSIVINANVTGKVTIDGNEVTIADGKGTFTIDNLAAGEHTVTAVFAGDKYFKADEKTAAFTVTKLDSPISIEIPKSQYTAFDNFQITIGNVTAVNVTVNSKAYAVKADGTVDIDTTALDAGAYTVVVSNAETATYKANSTSKSFTIVKKASEVSIDVGASYNVGDDFAIEIDNNTAATVTINGDSYEIKDGKVVVDTTALAAGEYTVFASIAGDGKYLASNATATFNVNKLAAPAILITHGEAIEGSDMAVDVIIVGASGVVNINGKNITLTEAKATTTFTDLLAGNMVVNVLYFGDAKYLGASNSSTIVVKAKENADLKVTVSDIKVGETAVVNVEINSKVTGKVTINGNEVNIAEGKGTFTIAGLSAGEYNVTAIFAGDKYFNAGNATAAFKVAKVETPADDNTTIPLDGAAKESKTPTYTISLPSDATGTLTVTVDGKNYTAEVVNGQASVPVSGLSAGNHKVTITYSGDSKYSPIVKSTTTNVVVDPKVVIKQSTVSYTAKYSATVYGKDGKVAKNTNVVFYINGKKIKTAQTNSKGVATFNLPNNYLPNKKYTIKATALGKSASKKVTVKQVLTLRKAEIKKSKNLVLIASVKKIDGKYPKGKVTFYLNGKKVKSVSISSKGIAKGTISKSKFNKLSVGSRMTYKAVYLKASVQKNTKLKT